MQAGEPDSGPSDPDASQPGGIEGRPVEPSAEAGAKPPPAAETFSGLIPEEEFDPATATPRRPGFRRTGSLRVAWADATLSPPKPPRSKLARRMPAMLVAAGTLATTGVVVFFALRGIRPAPVPRMAGTPPAPAEAREGTAGASGGVAEVPASDDTQTAPSDAESLAASAASAATAEPEAARPAGPGRPDEEQSGQTAAAGKAPPAAESTAGAAIEDPAGHYRRAVAEAAGPDALLALIGPILAERRLQGRDVMQLAADIRSRLTVDWAMARNDAEGKVDPLYRDAVRREPQHPYLLQEAADHSIALGRFDEATRFFSRALTLNPRDLPTFVRLLNLLLDRGETAQARRLLELGVRVHPEIVLVRLNLADLLRRSGNVSEAYEQYQIALAFEPGNLDACYGLGRTLIEAPSLDPGGALSGLENALKLHAGDFRLRGYYAVALGRAGETDRAGEILEQLRGSAADEGQREFLMTVETALR